MHRVIWWNVGGKRIHLLKLAGAFFITAAIFKVAEASYNLFVTANKVSWGFQNVDLIPQLFGWTIDNPYALSFQDAIGIMMGPIANFMFWLGVTVVAFMIYNAGNYIYPSYQYEAVRSSHENVLREGAKAKVEEINKGISRK